MCAVRTVLAWGLLIICGVTRSPAHAASSRLLPEQTTPPSPAAQAAASTAPVAPNDPLATTLLTEATTTVGIDTTTVIAPAQSAAGSSAVANTITITQGGTYSGDWVSTNPTVPAVLIATDDPVVIQNSTVTGPGHLIRVSGNIAANLTVRNVTGLGTDPMIAGAQRGAFVVAYHMNSLIVQNCTMSGVSFGIKTGFSSPSVLRILNNLATNLEDRASDGNGGFQTARPQHGHFALLYQSMAAGGAEIGWNQVVQTMGQSSIDDVISVYNSQGASGTPISIHDNYMEGYSSPGTAAYSASGMNVTGAASPADGFVLLSNNQMVHAAGSGLTVANGHDVTAQGNRVVSCGQDSSGTWYTQTGHTAAVLWNRGTASSFYNNAISGTTGGMVVPDSSGQAVASDLYANPNDLLTTSNSASGNQFDDPCLVAGTLNLSAEDAERTAWSNKVSANHQAIGDQHSTVSITPAAVVLQAGQTQQFAGSAVGEASTAVSWSMTPAVGSLSSAGLYTAPTSVSSTQTVTVTATSVSDALRSSSATVTLAPPVSVSVTPGTTSLQAGQLQQFSATVSNAANTAVTWSISPAIGSISSTGLYTAPSTVSSAQTITLTTTSVADTTKSASALVTVTPATITLTPMTVSLYASQSQTFHAILPPGVTASVAWSISPAVGMVTSDGTYTAPSSINSAQTVTVTGGYSAADGYQWTSARINLLPPVKVNLTSDYFPLTVGQTAQFTAVVQNTANNSVTWSINPAVGSISAAGLYAAPSSITAQQTVTVTATSVADPAKSVSGSVVLNPPVSVNVSPASATLPSSGTLQLTGSVAWNSNTAVTWSVAPAVGSISASGLYTAPASVSLPQTVVVTATSVADPTKSASATLTITPPSAVSVTPAAATITVGQTQLYGASVAYAANQNVTWSISPTVGSIAANGRYSPPSSPLSIPQTVTITATSVTDTTKSASASVTINPPVAITVAPGSVSLYAAQSQVFTAGITWSSNTGVTWSISPSVGSIASDGTYTAPSSITSVQTVTITADSVADTSKYATARITLLPPVKVNLVNGYFPITVGQTAQFSAVVQNSPNQAVTWSVSPATGSISDSGLYTPPSSITAQQTITVTATSVADPGKSVNGTVVLNPPVRVSVSPATSALSPSAALQLTASVAWSSNTAVIWSLSPALGSLSSGGLYTAPSDTTTVQTVTITATSVADPSKSASALLTLNPPPVVSVTPSASTITLGQTQLLAASVLYAGNTNVTWSITPAIGSISSGGRYSPPSAAVTSPQTVTVTATSAADSMRTASASVTVNPPVGITVSPAVTSLYASQTQQFTGAVTWNNNTAVNWSIAPSVGAIDSNGLYTAPSSIASAQSVTVTATSVADGSKYALAKIQLVPPVKVNLLTSYLALTAGQTGQFAASVLNTSNAAVTWSISPAVGTIAADGTYTAPASVVAQQSITVTATSIADPSKSASGWLLLNPPVSVATVPAAVTLTRSHSQQFAANVAWASNTGVTWAMTPQIGTLTSSGLYTAPDTINSNQTVTVTATSLIDPTKSASATVSLLTLIGPAPITITEGGMYSGDWISNDPNVPAVTIATDQPVIIQNSTVKGSSNLIRIIGASGANVVIQNVTASSVDPMISGVERGAFVKASAVSSLTVQNCTITGASFGVVVSMSPNLSSLLVTRNIAMDLEDRASDGNGGFLNTRPILGHFFQLSTSTAGSGAEVSWNQVNQTMGRTSTEDVINIYKSQGAAGAPINVHDNYMEGYSSVASASYSGNGVISDGVASAVSAYILFQANQMVHTSGGGVAIASGHDVTATGNRVVSCGVDATGRAYATTGTATYLGDYYGAGGFYNNTLTGTRGGLVALNPAGTFVASDLYAAPVALKTTSNSIAGNQFTDPCFVNGSINLAAEDAERTFWSNKLTTSAITLGDQH